MDEKALKTTVGQRIVIAVIAILLLGSTMLTYMFVVLSGNSQNNGSSTADTAKVEEKVAELKEKFDAKSAEITEAGKPLSEKYYPEFSKHLGEVKAYNEAAATSAVLDKKDLKVGTGKELTEGDKEYFAYYVGWCADGEIFDSSLDDKDEPTGLKSPLDPSGGLIEGWEQGVIGMKLGGVRMITMNGDLAYGDNREICGGYNKPLKFIVMAVEQDEKIKQLDKELTEIYNELYAAYAGTV